MKSDWVCNPTQLTFIILWLCSATKGSDLRLLISDPFALDGMQRAAPAPESKRLHVVISEKRCSGLSTCQSSGVLTLAGNGSRKIQLTCLVRRELLNS